MQQHSRCQKVVSMQLSLLADNRDALSLSFEEGESAFPLQLLLTQPACTPAATTAAAAALAAAGVKLLTCHLFEM